MTDSMDAEESSEKARPAKTLAAPPDIGSMSDEELLQMRMCDLKLKIEGTELESRINKFYTERAAKGVGIKPI